MAATGLFLCLFAMSMGFTSCSSGESATDDTTHEDGSGSDDAVKNGKGTIVGQVYGTLQGVGWQISA